MIFQKVLKGIAGIGRVEAENIMKEGILSNWYRKKVIVTETEINEQLTEAGVIQHLNDYANPVPATHPMYSASGLVTYGQVTPFISTSAGSVDRLPAKGINIITGAMFTALSFATQNFTSQGIVFYAYVMTIGKKAIAFSSIGEEVRDLHIYQRFLPYYHEGEIVAKIVLPSPQIEKWELYDGPALLKYFPTGTYPLPILDGEYNPDYANPDDYNNVRQWY